MTVEGGSSLPMNKDPKEPLRGLQSSPVRTTKEYLKLDLMEVPDDDLIRAAFRVAYQEATDLLPEPDPALVDPRAIITNVVSMIDPGPSPRLKPEDRELDRRVKAALAARVLKD
jgi:hypothetical protein